MKNNIKAYYNEWDKDAAAWLRQLIKNGLITDGVVDERSITEVSASDIRGFDRVHWFAGIGTWDYCLSESGWGDRPVWTASLPCQPFSAAGKQLGKEDERHLLPHFLGLVRECKPDVIFGEQVGRAIQHGWLDDLHAEMEAQEYAIGHIVFGAHSIGAAHIRQRLYWVANSIDIMHKRAIIRSNGKKETASTINWENIIESRESCRTSENVRGMGNPEYEQHERRLSGYREEPGENGQWTASEFAGSSQIGGMGINDDNRCKQGSETTKAARYRNTVDSAGGIDWLYCRDGKYRPVKSGIKPLVNGSARGMVRGSDQSEEEIKPNETAEAHAMRLKGYGNAIVSGCTIEFIKTFMGYQN